MIADNYQTDFPPPADEQADLPVNFQGKKTQLTGQFLGNDVSRSDIFPIKSFDLFNLRSAQAHRISENFVDMISLKVT
jgi:hypothetical protein